jgi:hypothetical protein
MRKQWTIAPNTKAPAAKGTDVTTSKEIQSPQGYISFKFVVAPRPKVKRAMAAKNPAVTSIIRILRNR